MFQHSALILFRLTLAAILLSPACRAQEAKASGNLSSRDVGRLTAVNFGQDVFPILQRSCFQCHGPEKQEAELRLDSKQSLINSSAIIGGDPEHSELIRRIKLPRDHEQAMPLIGDPLPPDQVRVLSQWVLEGAPWPDDFMPPKHWAYVVPVRPDLPLAADDPWSRTAIDGFVLNQMTLAGMKPSPAAEPELLLRRVSLDLIGLPPTPSEVDAFTRDPSEEHYQQIVDALLDRPQFGEKWARPWLDLARYADSHGFQRDDLRDNWAWRDWVIRALNDDMPFDQFTIEQIAGDLLPNATESQKIATGFHRSSPTNVEAGSLPEETRAEQLIDRVNTTASVWLGTTLECAQCHDHKYDPFPTADYYRLLAFFNNTAIEADLTNPKQPSSIAFLGPSMPLSDPDRDRNRKTLTTRLREIEESLEMRRNELMNDLGPWSRGLAADLQDSSVTHPLPLSDFRSRGNTDSHEILEDGSILLIGNDPPDTDHYTVTATVDLSDIRAFRLDALTHDSLPGTGPGRGDSVRTNFVLNEFSVLARTDSDRAPVPLKFASASADFSQADWDVFGAVDGKAKTGWAIAPQFGRPHWAVFVLAEPLSALEGASLTFQLEQEFGSARTLGRFRISAVTGSVPGEGAAGLPGEIVEILKCEESAWKTADRIRLVDYRVESDPKAKKLKQQIASAKSDLAKLAADTTLVMQEQPPRTAYIYERGDYRQRGPEVQPGTPASLHPMPQGPLNRLTLAKWLVDPANPLVARVAVNRWWAEIFGRGLVTTAEDFGVKGTMPSHPQLLDWLAVEFMESGWSMKHVLRTIVLSSVYRQSSRITPELAEADDQNRLMSRGPRFRLDAETIRDNALAISGLLNLKQFGPPIRPAQPAGLWAKVGGVQYDYVVSEGTERHRRGIYVVLKRSAPYPSFVNFDASARLACTVSRSRTNTPLQALTLLNDPVYVEASRALARRALTEKPDADFASRLRFAFQLCTSRNPTNAELNILSRHYENQLASFRNRPDDVSQITKDETITTDLNRVELAAWYSLSAVLLNLHETITKP